MSDRSPQENTTIEELRRSLFEKLRAKRSKRLEDYHRTGRILNRSSEKQFHLDDGISTGRLHKSFDLPNTNIPNQKRYRFVDKLLLSIEILAILGLLFIAYSGFNILQAFNQEMAKAMAQPTPSITPIVQAVVLPSGHTPPTSPGGAKPNEAEIPENLRPLVESLANQPVPTPAPQHATHIQIPSIDVDAPVVQGDSWEQLIKGVGQHLGSANPGEDSNMVLSAHNDIYGEIFRYLDRLIPGDQVIVHTQQSAYTYLVAETQIVNPDHIEVLAPTNHPIVTLISCYPYLINNKRIVVTAHLYNEGH
ncbi:MAG: class D sortase [Anaerolineales bacterium]|nr:class D sortase [Anaerolineales bacterium]